MSALDLAQQNLTSPMVLAFVLGFVAVRLKSDLSFPDQVTSLLSTYLLLAIGFKGGTRLKEIDPIDVAVPAIVTVAAGVVIAYVTYLVARKFIGLTPADSASLAAHFGSVSAVTFTAAETFARESGGVTAEYLPLLVVLLEVPGIIVALMLWTRQGQQKVHGALSEVLTGKSIVLLGGGLVIGALANDSAMNAVEPLFVGLFPGVLTLFLLDLGTLAGSQLATIRRAGVRLIGFGVLAPILFGLLGVILGLAVGMSPSTAAVFAAMLASASYIAAPAAVRIGIPPANTGLALGVALGITFPFNIVIGIPVYSEIAQRLG
ncbi:MAG: sodium-dependent bicarbonate transport family permease [Ilumatobacteraceae bacterium]